MQHSDGLEFFRHFARRGEFQRFGRQRLGGQGGHEVENARLGPLVLAEGLVVHEQIDGLARHVGAGEPADVFVGCQRPLAPVAVREAERDVVAELEVAQQQVQLRVDRVGVDEVRTFPTQNVLRPLGEHRAEAQRGDDLPDTVRIDQFGVAKGLRLDAELLLDRPAVLANLVDELLFADQRGQRVGVRFGQKLDASGAGQRLKAVEHFGRVHPELFDRDARDREGNLEFLAVLADQLQQQLVHRQIAPTGHFLHDRPVRVVVQVEMVLAHVEEAVFLQSQRLVDLKIEADGFHMAYSFFVFPIRFIAGCGRRWRLRRRRFPT